MAVRYVDYTLGEGAKSPYKKHTGDAGWDLYISEDCEIEVFSEEPGMGFSEHYIFKNGECLCDEEREITSGGYDENGKPTEDIDWENYDGDTIIFNPYRFGRTGDFLWCF